MKIVVYSAPPAFYVVDRDLKGFALKYSFPTFINERAGAGFSSSTLIYFILRDALRHDLKTAPLLCTLFVTNVWALLR